MRPMTDPAPFRRRVTVLATVAALAVLLAVPSAEAKGSGFFGLNYTFQKLHGKDVGKLKKSGSKTVRWTFFWPRIEHSSGQYDWSGTDKLVGDLASKGIRVVPVLFGTPNWLSKTTGDPPVDSKKARDAWQAFVRQAVSRYGPNGSYWTLQYTATHPAKAALPITTWQIWNEPNLKSHFSSKHAAGDYAKLLKLSHSAIRQQDPGASVMFAGMPGYSNDMNAWRFLDKVYEKHGVKKAFDFAALHPYARNVNQMLGEVKRVRKVMSKNGDAHKPLWVTEIGWGSAKPTRFGLTKGKQGQARILKKAFKALKGRRHSLHIKRVLWFNYRDPQGHAQHCSFCSSSGLLKENYKTKPAWQAFRSFTG
jgi:polysaccharide biosynthesis protein PslG